MRHVYFRAFIAGDMPTLDTGVAQPGTLADYTIELSGGAVAAVGHASPDGPGRQR